MYDTSGLNDYIIHAFVSIYLLALQSNELQNQLNEFDGNVSEFEFSDDGEEAEDFENRVNQKECNSDGSEWLDEDNVPLSSLVSTTGQRGMLWKRTKDFEKSVPVFEQEKEQNIKKPMEYFEKYLSNDFFNEMARCTNMRGVSVYGKSFGLTEAEVKKFWGVSIIAALLGFPRLRMCWESKTRYPLIADNISRDRFHNIRNNLKVVDDNDSTIDKSDRFWKVRPMLTRIRNGCLSNRRTKRVSIDEQMIPFHGKVHMRQYIRGKPNPVGMKNFVLCTHFGLPLDFDVYQGRGTEVTSTRVSVPEKLDVGGRYVLKLADTVLPGTIIYMDRYFSSVVLFETLLNERDIQATGTIMNSRIPKNARLQEDNILKKRGRGSFDQLVRSDEKIVIVKWFDNRGISIISSETGANPLDECRRWSKKENSYVAINMPNCFKMYNSFMGGVDIFDRVIAKYAMRAPTKKWTVRAIHHFMDFVIAACYIEYKSDAQKINLPKKEFLSYYNFKMVLAEQFIYESGTQSTVDENDHNENEQSTSSCLKRRNPQPLPHKGKRLASAAHMPDYCEQKTRSRCRLPGCNNLTFWKCCTCEIYLCLTSNRNCFKIFHTNK